MARLRLRTDRLATVAAVALLFVLAAIYYVIQRGKLGNTRLATDRTLLALLSVAILGLLLGLFIVGVRNLAGVLSGRRRGVLGSRLQARVTFAFLFLALIPSLTLFVGAVAIVRKTMSDLRPPEPIPLASEFVDQVRDAVEARARHFAGVLARDLAPGAGAADEAQGELARRLDERRRRYALDAVGLVPRVGAPISVAGAPSAAGASARATEITSLPDGFAGRVLDSGRPAVLAEELAVGARVLAAHPIEGARPPAFAWVAIYLPPRSADLMAALARAGDEWRGFGRSRTSVENLYITIFALLSGLVLFAAVWAGFLIARQVTGPILELARGTEALAEGDLSYRVAENTGDELGRLAASFNRMAREIERNRRTLEDRRRYIEELLESIPVGVLSFDAQGRATTANHAALELLRLETLVAGSTYDTFLDGGRAPLARALEPVIAGAVDRVASEVAIAARDGQVSLSVVASRFPVTRGGEAVLVVLEDLTRLRRAERLAAWGEVARRLAHEIKNPLTPIRLSAERMLRKHQKQAPDFAPVLEDGVATIVREVESIERLVSEFSRFARLPEIRPRPASLVPVVEDALALYRHAHPGVAFELEAHPALPAHRIDPEALRRCLINLLDNAVAVVGPGGRIAVRTYPGRGTVTLEVADNGPGVAPEDRERLFQPDFTRRPGGTGLGLAIVEQIVVEHGGRVRVADNPGGGTRFMIDLPAAGAAALT